MCNGAKYVCTMVKKNPCKTIWIVNGEYVPRTNGWVSTVYCQPCILLDCNADNVRGLVY